MQTILKAREAIPRRNVAVCCLEIMRHWGSIELDVVPLNFQFCFVFSKAVNKARENLSLRRASKNQTEWNGMLVYQLIVTFISPNLEASPLQSTSYSEK